VIIIPSIFVHSELIPHSKAKQIVFESFSHQDRQKSLTVMDACGRILASPVFSNRTHPPQILAGPDGIAVKSEDTTEAGEDRTVELDVPRVNTGMPVPDGFNAVIPIEEVIHVTGDRYKIHTPVTPYQNTIQAGSDIEKGDMVMDSGHLVNPFDIGALLTYGIRSVTVKDWKIGLIATGDEIIPSNKSPLPGQIIDTNSSMVSMYLQPYGVTPVIAPITPDDPVCLAQELNQLANDCDIVLIFGGSSAGSKDFTVDAMKEKGTLLFHGVAMAPGKPVSLARIHGKPVFGMPGPSIGSLVVLYELVYPLLRQWGVPIPPDTSIKGLLTASVSSFNGFDMFLMMSVEAHGEKVLISPVERRFGQMMGVRANAILHKKAGTGDIQAGEEVEVRVIRSLVNT